MNIIKKNGYVYQVKGSKGFETFYNLGKDPDDVKWKPEIKEEPSVKEEDKKEVSETPKKKPKKAVVETEEQKESEA